MTTTIRAFIAIELPGPVTAALLRLQNQLKKSVPIHAVRWVAPQNIHLTLHFLGDIAAGDVDKISAGIEAVAAPAAPFELSVGGLGCFPNLHRPRVVWVGLPEKHAALAALHQNLGRQLQAAINFSPETRPFAPHLTLGRVSDGGPPRDLRQLSATIEQHQRAAGKLAELPVTAVSFIKSELRPSGAVYSLLSRHNLRG